MILTCSQSWEVCISAEVEDGSCCQRNIYAPKENRYLRNGAEESSADPTLSRNSRSRLRRVVVVVPPLSSKLGEVCFLRQQSFCVHSSILCPIQCSILELLFQRRALAPLWSNIILMSAHILTAQTPVVENMVFRPPKKFWLFNYLKSYKLFQCYNNNQRCQLKYLWVSPKTHVPLETKDMKWR